MVTIGLLLMIWETMHRKRLIGVSIKQLQREGYYRQTGYEVNRLTMEFNRLLRYGYVAKTVTKSGVLWSLSGSGKEAVRDYCEWLGGTHDAEIGLDASFIEKSSLWQ